MMAEKLYYIVIIASFVFLLLTIFIVYISAFQNQKKNFYRNELFKAHLEIKEQTLKHIAYELHDNLGQVASLIKINLNTLQLDDRTKAAQKIDDTKELVRQMITDLKLLSVNLNSDRIIQVGLVKAIGIEVERLNKTGQFETSFQTEGAIPDFDTNTTIILYRMIQEIFNNIVKHSGAKRINVSINVIEKLFTLVITDDGKGFVLEDESKGEGSGLINLQNRARLIQAQYFIQSFPGDGTRICIEMPV